MLELSDCEEVEEDGSLQTLVRQKNRKQKKSGGFQSMGFSRTIFTGIFRAGYKIPTPIQRRAIPLILAGHDVVAMARTGSGKTAAFLLPILERLKTHQVSGARALIISPTRELALQTLKFAKQMISRWTRRVHCFRQLGKQTDLCSAVIVGGDSMEQQFAAVHAHPDILVATPGRFLHVLVEMDLKLSSVEVVCFDEGDRLFEMGFREQLQEILSRLPTSRQTLIFSATLPAQLIDFSRAGLHSPILIRLDLDTKLSDRLETFFFHCRHEQRESLLLHLIQDVIPEDQQVVVFAATKHHVEYLSELITSFGSRPAVVYSSLDASARKINIGRFRLKQARVLLVTDLAARGIDLPLLPNVINFHFPARPKLFVHRVGRVARAGASGRAYSLISGDELPYLIDLYLFLGKPMDSAFTGNGEGQYGSVGDSLLDFFTTAIEGKVSLSAELESLRRTADNALKQYRKSRPSPSAESIRRAKLLPAPAPHPLLAAAAPSDAAAAATAGGSSRDLIEAVHSYKPKSTIFEINANSRSRSVGVMRQKRVKDQKLVDRRRSGPSGGGDATETPTGTTGAPSEPYISYRREDDVSERALTIDFEREARKEQIDLMADDRELLYKQKAQKRWDRKRKKFVGDSSGASEKKIRTESGTKISASYKSGRYDKWRSKTKIDEWTSDGTPMPGTRLDFRGRRGTAKFRLKTGSKSAEKKIQSQKSAKSELKNPDQILKQRQQKARKIKQQKPKRKGAGKKRSKGKR